MKRLIILTLLIPGLAFPGNFMVPFSSGSSSGGGITSINGDSTSAQTITSGTSGTNVAVSTSGGTTTINIPDASATARGVITTGAQTIAGAKTFSSTITTGTATNYVSLYTSGGVAAVRMNSATTRYSDWYRYTDNIQYLADDTNGDRVAFGMNGNVFGMAFYGSSSRNIRWITDGSGGVGGGAATERPDFGYFKTKLGIGLSTTQEASAQLQGDSTTQGWLPPRMTSTQRDAITPVAGLIIYNTTTGKHEGYNGAWNAFY